MLRHLTLAIACCLPITIEAQGPADLREAAALAMPATVFVQLDTGAAADSSANLRWRPKLRNDQQANWWVFNQMKQVDESIRSGFALTPDLVITMNLPIGSDKVSVYTSGKSKLAGKVVLRDRVTGLAAVRVETSDSLAHLTISEEPAVPGLPVAITSMPDRENPLVAGALIASNPGTMAATRGFTQAIDGDVSSAATGSPIVNANGQLVGVVFLSDEGDVLSLPTGHVQRLLAAASEKEASDLHRGRIGVVLADEGNPRITSVNEGYPAQEAGLEPNDRLIKIGDREITSASDILAAVAMARAGDNLKVSIQRGDETMEKTVTLAKSESDPYAYVPAPAKGRQAFALKDGKLVPMDLDGEMTIENTRKWQDLVVPFQFTNPKQFQVERSALEKAIEELKAEKKIQDQKLRELSEKYQQLLEQKSKN